MILNSCYLTGMKNNSFCSNDEFQGGRKSFQIYIQSHSIFRLESFKKGSMGDEKGGAMIKSIVESNFVV